MKPPIKIRSIGRGLDEYYELRVLGIWMKGQKIPQSSRLSYSYGFLTFGSEGDPRDKTGKSYYIMRKMEAQKAGRSMGPGEFFLEPTDQLGRFKLVPVEALEPIHQ